VVTFADQDSFQIENGLEIKVLKSLNVFWDYWNHKNLAQRIVWQAVENFNPRVLVRISREVREFRPDVVSSVSSENVNVASWLAAHLEGIPVAHIMYGYSLMCWRGSMFRNGRNCQHRCAKCLAFTTGRKFMTRYVDGIAAESLFVINRHLDEGYFTNAVSRVFPGAIRELPPSSSQLEQEPHLRAGFIGRLIPEKGVETVLRAARLLPEEVKVEFIVAGDGDSTYLKQLQDLFPRSRTRFVGWMAPDEFFRQVDVNVVPSVYNEPFGRTSVESQAFGIPTLVARSGGLADNIVEGVTGFCFSPDDEVTLAAYIEKLASDRPLLRRMGAAAREHAVRFCLSNVAAQLEEFLIATRVHAQESGLLVTRPPPHQP
jgi:glycosyltransferase involved in cell wall biosynthesis